MRRLSLFVRSAVWVAVLPLLKRLVPVRRLAQLMWRRPRRPTRDRCREAEVVALVQRLYAHGRLPRPHNCLERSLLMYRLLAELSADPVLVVGLTKASKTRGHAWVLVDGVPVGEREETLEVVTPVLAFGTGGELLGELGAGLLEPRAAEERAVGSAGQ